MTWTVWMKTKQCHALPNCIETLCVRSLYQFISIAAEWWSLSNSFVGVDNVIPLFYGDVGRLRKAGCLPQTGSPYLKHRRMVSGQLPCSFSGDISFMRVYNSHPVEIAYHDKTLPFDNSGHCVSSTQGSHKKHGICFFFFNEMLTKIAFKKTFIENLFVWLQKCLLYHKLLIRR